MTKSKTQLKKEAHERRMREQALDKAARIKAATPKPKRHKPNHDEWRRQYAAMLKSAGQLSKPDITSVQGVGAVNSIFDSRWKNPYREDEDLAERERVAQEQAEEKKKRIAPAYGKGAYQYLTGPEGARDAGKKNSF